MSDDMARLLIKAIAMHTQATVYAQLGANYNDTSMLNRAEDVCRELSTLVPEPQP